MGESWDREQARLRMQEQLDALRTQAERNRLGQFATPTALAHEIVQETLRLRESDSAIRFLDPAFGTGAFYSALLSIAPLERIALACGYEVDEHYGGPALALWRDTALNLQIADFTAQPFPSAQEARFDMVVCNPPYVRHHHLINGDKSRLKAAAYRAAGMELSGLAGLYCYFLALAHPWMRENALAAWLIPSEFMDVNYGQAIKKYLLEQVTLVRIHRFDPNDVQFDDALVSSAVVWFRQSHPQPNNSVEFTFGGSISRPQVTRTVAAQVLAEESKWTRFPVNDARSRITSHRLSDFFTIKRGLATGKNDFFILSEKDIETRALPWECFRPILPSPRYLHSDEVLADTRGWPQLAQRRFLLDCRLNESQAQAQYPRLWEYLESGRETVSEQYLCRMRKVWYFQEERPPTSLLATYIGRTDAKSGRPFRFILNRSQATAANVYLMLYPKPALASMIANSPDLLEAIWRGLNSLPAEALVGEGRVYGGGLRKMEPKELGNVDASFVLRLLQPQQAEIFGPQLPLF